jgi:hypothetical protein
MKYWLVIASVFIMGCQDVKRPEKPKDLIPKEKMVEVLTEAYLSNSAQSVRNQSIFKEEVNLDSLFYAKFDIDSLQFVKSNNYYAFNSSLYIDILEKVEANLERIEDRLDSIRNTRKNQENQVDEAPKTDEE